MKIALIIYGHMRTYRECYPSLLNNLLGPLQPDVFIHTWDETEARTRTWHNRQGDPEPLDVDALRDLYRPKAMLVETQPPVDPDRVTPNNKLSYDGQRFMLESLQKACALRWQHEAANGVRYSVVIKIRPDIKLLEPLRFEIPDNNVVLIASNLRPDGKRKACDILNVATSANMDMVCTVHDHFEEFYAENFINGTFVHSGFVDFIVSLGLRPVYLDYHYGKQWTIVRAKK